MIGPPQKTAIGSWSWGRWDRFGFLLTVSPNRKFSAYLLGIRFKHLFEKLWWSFWISHDAVYDPVGLTGCDTVTTGRFKSARTFNKWHATLIRCSVLRTFAEDLCLLIVSSPYARIFFPRTPLFGVCERSYFDGWQQPLVRSIIRVN